MNYIKELNAFYNQMEVNPLSASATLLWYTLMQVNNRTGWKKNFTVAATVLRMKSGLKDSSFKRARDELKKKGLILFHSRGGNQAAIYEIIPLSDVVNYNDNYSTDNYMDESTDQNVDHNTDPLNKVKINENKTPNAASAIQFFKNNFGQVAHYIAQELHTWTNKLGDPMVIEAMKKALEQNKFNWSYVKSILLAWESLGLTSLQQVHEEEMQYKQQKKRKRTPPRQKTEVVPDWFNERKQQQQNTNEQHPEEKKENVAELIERYLERKNCVDTVKDFH